MYIDSSVHNNDISKHLLPIVSLFIFFLLSSVVIFYSLCLSTISADINKKIQAIQKDIHMKNGIWNMDRYNADPQLIGSYPLYVFTLDGFVLDRRSPIGGYLDISDFRRLLAYQKIQDVSTVTGQTRRVLSKPIVENNKIIGVVTVSYYNPPQTMSDTVDKTLVRNITYIMSHITVRNGTIGVNEIDQSFIDYNVAFTVVDSYNTILKKTNNVNNINKAPGAIDPSYIKSILSSPREAMVRDVNTGDIFLVKKSPLLDSEGKVIGVIVVGQTIMPVFSIVIAYMLLELLVSIGGLLVYLFLFSKNFVPNKTNKQSYISFSPQRGILHINEKDIKIPYATNQYYMLQVLFSKPSKRWETDELLERFGEQTTKNNWRVVYDTMVKINKKTLLVIPQKLILNQNKTYQLNQELLTSVYS